MSHAYRSHLIASSILTITLTLLATLFTVSQRSSAGSVPVQSNGKSLDAVRLLKSQLTKGATPKDSLRHELVVPFYNLSGGWKSTLMLTNQAPTLAEVRVTLFNLNGQRIEAPPATLEPRAARVFDLSDWVSAANFHKGSLEISYLGQERQVAGVVKVIDESHSLIFDQQLAEPDEYFKSSRLDGVWWLPSKKADVSVVICNTSDETSTASLSLYGPHPQALGSDKIVLHSHETRVINASMLIEKGRGSLPVIGAVSVTYSGEPGSVFASALIQEQSSGFSSLVELRDPTTALSSKFDGAGLRIGRFAGEALNQVAVARNIGENDSELAGRIVYTTSDGRTGVLTIPEVHLAPGTAADVDLARAIKKTGLRDVVAAGLEFVYTSDPGTIVMSALSVSQGGNHVFRVPLIDVTAQPTNTGQYPLTIDSDFSTLVYLKNATTETQKYTLNVEVDGSYYVQGRKQLEPGATFVFDFKKIRDEQIPDQNGYKVPLGAKQGYLSWSAHAFKHTLPGQMMDPTDHVMLGRSELADSTKGLSATATYGCNCPDSFLESWIEHRLPNGQWVAGGITIYAGETVHVRAMEQDHDCYWHSYPAYNAGGYLGSENDYVATFAPSYTDILTGVTGGYVNVGAQWPIEYWYEFYDCCWFQSDDTVSYTSVTVNGVTISGPQSVSDGSFVDPTFSLSPTGPTPSSYQWSWSSPPGAGNNPLVTFNPTNQASTVTNRQWFALPNVACPSPPAISSPPVSTDPYYNSIYTITGQGNFPNGLSDHKDSTLTVNNYWNPAGTTAPPVISGGVSVAPDGSGVWHVTGPGTATRNTPVVVIYVPINSQFYNKTVAHENRHVEQYVSGMNSDLFTIAGLMAQLTPLSDATQGGLNAKIVAAFNNWYAGEAAWLQIRGSAMEQDAHSVSDHLQPQYAYQLCH